MQQQAAVMRVCMLISCCPFFYTLVFGMKNELVYVFDTSLSDLDEIIVSHFSASRKYC